MRRGLAATIPVSCCAVLNRVLLSLYQQALVLSEIAYMVAVMKPLSKRLKRTIILAATVAVTSFAAPVANAAPSVEVPLGTFDIYATPSLSRADNTLDLVVVHDLAPSSPAWRLVPVKSRQYNKGVFSSGIAARLRTVVVGERSGRPVKGGMYRFSGTVTEERLCSNPGQVFDSTCKTSTFLTITKATKISSACVVDSQLNGPSRITSMTAPSVELTACASTAGVFWFVENLYGTRSDVPLYVRMDKMTLTARGKKAVSYPATQTAVAPGGQFAQLALPARGGMCTVSLSAMADAKDDGKDLVPYTGKGYVLTFAC